MNNRDRHTRPARVVQLPRWDLGDREKSTLHDFPAQGGKVVSSRDREIWKQGADTWTHRCRKHGNARRHRAALTIAHREHATPAQKPQWGSTEKKRGPGVERRARVEATRWASLQFCRLPRCRSLLPSSRIPERAHHRRRGPKRTNGRSSHRIHCRSAPRSGTCS